MSEKKIVIATVLKPVNDTRMYEKFALTLCKVKGFSINIVGFNGKIPQNGKINYFPLFGFQRTNLLKRSLAPLKFLLSLIKIRPDVIIVCTWELLISSALYKIFTGARLIYDIQENYYLNIVCATSYPKLLRTMGGLFIRTVERLSGPLISHYILAERIYTQQIRFTSGKCTVLENKLKRPSGRTLKQRDEKMLLFTGTIARETGVFEAIALARILHGTNSAFHLVIAGFCARKKDFQQLLKIAQEDDFVRIIGGNQLVPHEEIIELIQKAGYGVVHYAQQDNFKGKVPTKLFEYTGLELPVLLLDNQWAEWCAPYDAACVLSLDETPVEILEKITSMKYYTKVPGDEVLWKQEEGKLVEITAGCLNKIPLNPPAGLRVKK
ncbi:MAG: hypothetical protein OEX02_14725 [Cyclobacteriaceae bacterium]|nr:hypothetical protein [Cyclobacteriaceae bacterium]